MDKCGRPADGPFADNPNRRARRLSASELLNELAAARVSLLDPKKRAAYDQQLAAKLAAARTLREPPPHRLSRPHPRLKPRPVVPAFSRSRRGERRLPLPLGGRGARGEGRGNARSRPTFGTIYWAIRAASRRLRPARNPPKRPPPSAIRQIAWPSTALLPQSSSPPGVRVGIFANMDLPSPHRHARGPGPRRPSAAKRRSRSTANRSR